MIIFESFSRFFYFSGTHRAY